MADLETVKSLLKKAQKLQDPELLSIANDMLDGIINQEEATTEPEPPKKKRGRPRKKPQATTPRSKKNIVEQFTRTDGNAAKFKYQPVQAGVNTWKDDGSDDETSTLPDGAKTPEITLTPRTRAKIAKVTRICGQNERGEELEGDGCGKKFEVSSKYAREFFICDECISKKVKGR